MFYSSIVQIIVVFLIMTLIRSYFLNNQLNKVADELLIKDAYTNDAIGSYYLLANKTALNLELHEIGDKRKLDTIKFFPKSQVNELNKATECSTLIGSDNEKSKTCRLKNGNYIGVSIIKEQDTTLGYVLTQKRYLPVFTYPVLYDLAMIIVAIFITFTFNFIFLFWSMKHIVENNTKKLLDIISLKTSGSTIIEQIQFAEYELIAEKFIEEHKQNEDLQTTINQQKVENALIDLTAMVAHDIGTPISGLYAAVANLRKANLINADLMLLDISIKNIKEITSGLLERYRKATENPTIQNQLLNLSDDGSEPRYVILHNILDEIVISKSSEWLNNPCQFQYNIEHSQCYMLWAYLSPIELKRKISNLLNNAYESLGAFNRSISIKLEYFEKQFLICISDTGGGIPTDQLDKVIYGKSLKHFGKGLGLSSAVDYFCALNGDLTVKSIVGCGTEVKITFPISKTPAWYSSVITYSKNSTFFILDDDTTTHMFWQQKLSNKNINLKIFATVTSFFEWCTAHSDFTDVVFLIDYDLHDAMNNGLDVIKKLNVNKDVYLITSYAEEPFLQKLIVHQNIFLIPKNNLSNISLKKITN